MQETWCGISKKMCYVIWQKVHPLMIYSRQIKRLGKLPTRTSYTPYKFTCTGCVPVLLYFVKIISCLAKYLFVICSPFYAWKNFREKPDFVYFWDQKLDFKNATYFFSLMPFHRFFRRWTLTAIFFQRAKAAKKNMAWNYKAHYGKFLPKYTGEFGLRRRGNSFIHFTNCYFIALQNRFLSCHLEGFIETKVAVYSFSFH